MKTKLDLTLTLLFVVLSLALQIIFLNPPVLSDQLEYFVNASSFFGERLSVNHRDLRLGLIIPAAFLIQIFGYSEIAYYAFPFLGMAALVAGTYQIARNLFSRRVAVFSSLFLIILPGILIESGHLLPDVPAAGMAALAFGLISSFSGQKEKSSFSTNIKFFVSGLLLGWAYLTREFILFIYPIAVLVFWAKEIPWKKIFPLVLGIILMFSLEWAYGIIAYGNPFIHLISAEPRLTEGKIDKDVLMIVSFLIILLKNHRAVIYIVLLGCAVIAPLTFSKNDKKMGITIFIWLVLGYTGLTAAGLLPVVFNWTDRALLRLHLFRYWIMLMPPMVIGGVTGLLNIFRLISHKSCNSSRRLDRVILAALIVLFVFAFAQSIQYLSVFPRFIRNGNDHYLEFREFLKRSPYRWDTIWVTTEGTRAGTSDIPMYIRSPFGITIWNGEFRYLNKGGKFMETADIDQGLVIINQYFLNPDVTDVPEYVANPPPDWELVFLSENTELVAYEVNPQAQ